MLGLIAWVVTMTAFYIYFNPDGVMLYAVQVAFVPLFLAAREFAGITSTFKYVCLAGFLVLMILRNVSALYATVEIAPRP